MASPHSSPNSPGPRIERELEDLVANLFRENGWRVKQEHSIADKDIDLIVARGKDRYIIELKAASEGRIGSYHCSRRPSCKSEPILRHSPQPAAPPAIVGAPAISPSAAKSLVSFLSQFAPDVAVGILDREGFRHFVGLGLEKLNAAPPSRAHRRKLSPPESAYRFPISVNGC